MTNQIKPDITLDLYGLMCPLPIAEASKKVKEMKVGEILKVISTDKGIKKDFPAWCNITGQELIKIEEDEKEEIFKIYIKKIK